MKSGRPAASLIPIFRSRLSGDPVMAPLNRISHMTTILTAEAPPRAPRPAAASVKRRSLPPGEAAQTGGRTGERIAKRLARAGIASRRDAEALIADGRVKVNGAVLASPAFNVTAGRPHRARRQADPADRAHAAVPVPQAGAAWSPPTAIPEGRRTVFDASAGGPAAADDHRPARHQHRGPAAAHQ